MANLPPAPCAYCPYRRDAPSGLWAPQEYAKLPAYDAPTGEQPAAAFHCHERPDDLCYGWAVCHANRGHAYDLLALRFSPPDDDVPNQSPIPLFTSGAEAASHGLRDLAQPALRAREAAQRLTRRHPRLRKGELSGSNPPLKGKRP